jgi:hypothetical protein
MSKQGKPIEKFSILFLFLLHCFSSFFPNIYSKWKRSEGDFKGEFAKAPPE